MIDTGYLIILYSIVKNAQRLPLEPSVFQFFRVLFSLHFLEYISVIMLPSEILYSPLPVIQRTRITINSLNDEIIPLQFRFLNQDQLQRLLIRFQFPPKLTNAEGYNFLHSPNRLRHFLLTKYFCRNSDVETHHYEHSN